MPHSSPTTSCLPHLILEAKKFILLSKIFKAKCFSLSSSSTLNLPSQLLGERKKNEDLRNVLKKPRIVLTDRILDEAASEVAEDLEWDQLMKEWNIDCEDIPFLITF
jgi:hypothetical protein